MPSKGTIVGQHIREKVIPAGMSVTDAAARLGVGRPALSNVLNGKATLSPKMALRLERAFDVSRAKLLELQASQDDKRGEESAVAVRRYVPTFLTIKARDIANWAEDWISTREHLPVLLRKLVHATGRDLERTDFPGHDSSQRPGWDGWVEARTATAWIPEGASGWEFGTSARPRQKAESDYAKRLNLPLQERAQCTFVFVTPRNWPGKEEWAKEKKVSGNGWRDVRAYDASDLEQWLEESVAAPVWLSERLREAKTPMMSNPTPVESVETLEAHWSKWASASTPNMTKHIFEDAVADCFAPFKRWLEGPPDRPFLVAADAKDEALAFIACLFEHNDIPAHQRDLAAVFTSSKMLDTLAKASSPFIPIAANAETQESLSQVLGRMHCIATCPRNAVDAKPDFALPLMGHAAFEKALDAMGFGRHDVPRLISWSGRSPTILRRRLSRLPAIRTPPWASDQTLARRLVPICLVGAWHVHKSADQRVIEKLMSCGHEEVERHIATLQQVEEDCPVWSVGHHRGVTSKVDALFAIAPLMTEQDIGNFLEVAEDVLSEPDPALELPESERWMAVVHDKVRDHSAALRNGICETLVLLSVHGDDLFRERLGIDVAGRVSGLVTRLLTPLDEKLYSQERDLPAYAEAAPSEFLEMLEEDLKRGEPAVLRLLKPVPSTAFSHSPRTSLLWALECAAWNPGFLPRVCVVLAQLSRIKIDDNLVNKPFASLVAILRPCMPQTAASLADRKAVLKMLVERFPSVAWRLCVDAIWDIQLVMDSYRPRWRSDASGSGGIATESQVRDFLKAAKDILLEWREHDQSTFGDLVGHMASFTEGEQSAVWAQIEAWAGSKADDRAKAELRERIRCAASGDSARLMYEKLRPEDLIVRHRWLFANGWLQTSRDDWAAEKDDFEAQQVRVDGLRQSAMEEIWAVYGLAGVITMVESGSDGYTVGRYAASCATNTADVLRACVVREVAVAQFDRAVAAVISARANPAESEVLLDVSQQLDHEQAVRLWRCAPFQDETWRLLDRLPDEKVHTAYWRTISPTFHKWFTEAECTEVVERLLSVGRPRTAFTVLARRWDDIETGSLKRLLTSIVSTSGGEDAAPIAPSDVSDALDALGGRQGVSSREMARLEFAFSTILGKRSTRNLERLIAESPAVFVELLAYIFRRRDGGQDPEAWQVKGESRRKAVASAAYQLLQKASHIPGGEAGSSINADVLLHWLTEARQLCAAAGREVVGDHHIGELLSKAPPDEDGVWPCDAVCQALEATASQDVVQGFVIGKRNARGAFDRRGEGGDDERELAVQHRRWARHRRFDYPFASRAIELIAESYDRDAKRQDTEAKVEKRLNTWG